MRPGIEVDGGGRKSRRGDLHTLIYCPQHLQYCHATEEEVRKEGEEPTADLDKFRLPCKAAVQCGGVSSKFTPPLRQ